MKRVILSIILFLLLILGLELRSNNIQVSNVTLTGQNTAGDFTFVQFDLTWENSWRTSSASFNWDAAWIFVKYRVGSGEWQHAWLNDAGHNAGTGTGATIDAGLLTPGSPFNATTNPALGAFIYRSADGTGNFGITGAQLRWNYGANGVADDAQVEVKLFAIEMVYVPQGSFTVGTTGSETGVFTAANDVSSPYTPFTITSTPPVLQGINASSSPANLSATGGFDLTGTTTATLATGFPTGYEAFYSMKYEISQQQYVDFLNTLTQTQANNRKYSGSSSRYAITGSIVGSYATTNPFVACNYLSWPDGTAYADWSGLRPMTELEFEKGCRGPVMPVANEYAWGNSSIIPANNITNAGSSSEYTNTSGANAVYGYQLNVQGPMRVGVFAKNNTTRSQAGAGYWGIMELSGNGWDRVVTLGNASGRSFEGEHGNGSLSPSGHANETSWPGLNAGEVTGASGAGYRGGRWTLDESGMRVSDRSSASSTDATRSHGYAFRAVRSMPFVCGTSNLVVNHRAGAVAPVDKVTSYGTVTNIPGETSKCWITKNLGATQQATSVDDATETSAGWYWQFNRKQGYRHDGTTLTPAWTITYINENTNWQTANDPCSIEMGSPWRIPTYTEWHNADHPSGGNWANWNGPWNSGLKLHAAGSLLNGDGSLLSRASIGRYWSNGQSSSDHGWVLTFYHSYSTMENGSSKASGHTLRCIKD